MPGFIPNRKGKAVNTIEPINNPVESLYFPLDLPSKFIFYPIDEFHLRPYSFMEAVKLAYARKNQDLLAVYEVMSASFKNPEFFPALTSGDFDFLLYWHRVNSYPKSPNIATIYCADKKHNADVLNGEAAPETLRLEHIIHTSDIERMDIDFPEQIGEFVSSIEKDTASLLTAPCMADEIFFLKERKTFLANKATLLDQKKTDDADKLEKQWNFFANNYGYARYLNTKHGSTLMDRIKYLETLPNTNLMSAMIEFKELIVHGATEYTTVTCDHCKTKNRYLLEVGITDFFPSL